MPNAIRRLFYWMRQRRMERELAEEMEFHRAMKQTELEEEGLPAEEAASAARRSLGNLTRMREESRAVWIAPWLESVWQDVCYAARNLAAHRGFTVTALTALAVAIGLNTSVFTVFNALAFRPWPVRDADRVVLIYGVPEGGAGGARGFPVPAARYFHEHAKTFAGLIATRTGSVQLGSGKAGREAPCGYVTADYFGLLGVPMEMGRGFLADEDLTAAPKPVTVLSWPAWQAQFGADPDIVGKEVRINEVPFKVVGVAARDFPGTAPMKRLDLWIPIAAMTLAFPGDSFEAQMARGEACCPEVAGRLAPGAGRERARAELEVLAGRFAAGAGTERKSVLLSATPMLARPDATGTARSVFALLFAGVTLLLLLACANIGNLLLARAAARQREIAVRLALGAGRGRVVRQLLTESMVLAAAAGVIGVCLAMWLPERVLAGLSGEPMALRLTPNALVLVYTLAVSALACVAFGLAPALHATRTALSGAMTRRSARRTPLRSVLLAGQVAISIVLLVAAALLVRGIQNAQSIDPGFALRGVAVASIELPVNAYDGPRKRAFVAQLQRELESLPELQPAGLTSYAPLAGGKTMTNFRFPGEDGSQPRFATVVEANSAYFDVLKIPVLAGRNFEPADASRNVLLVNQSAGKRFWPGENPVGKTVVMRNEPHEVAGVVRDARTVALDGVEPIFYLPLSGWMVPHVLAPSGGAANALPALISRLDPRAAVRVKPLSENLDRALANSQVGAALAGALGLLALALATVGMFGVFRYVVEQRTTEIGIRMALGARPGQVIASVLRSSSRAVAAGLALGFAGAAAAARVIESHLYGAGTLDPLAYVGVGALLSAAALAATFLPARRAARIEPVAALRYE